LIIHGDSLEKLKELEPNSVDAVITDPPYGLSFMGKKWDYEVPSVALWKEVFRVLKPGGHALSFGGTRTYHRLVCAIEDGGFEIRDQIQWIYGSGFPKSLDVSKAVDKAAGAKRDVIGKKSTYREPQSPNGWDCTKRAEFETAPATDSAKQWQGFGTALKPANEPIVLARKPLSEKTVAKNVLKWGTGALNIDGSRIGTADTRQPTGKSALGIMNDDSWKPKNVIGGSACGRWPANVLFDGSAAEMLDEQTQHLHGAGRARKAKRECEPTGDIILARAGDGHRFGDSGGASRFFYCAKSSKPERSKGLNGFDCATFSVCQGEESTALVLSILKVISALIPNSSIVSCGENITAIFPRECLSTTRIIIQQITELKTWNLLMLSRTSDSMKDVVSKATSGISHVNSAGSSSESTIAIGILVEKVGSATADAKLATLEKLSKLNDSSVWKTYSSNHPTVKPLKLMEYLCRLITPPGGTVLDPFAGSGSTGVAAKRLGFKFIGIEMNDEYVEIARRRLESAEEQQLELA
jgi:site-specific DNA-methyltransferase (adenine-specific)